MSSKVPKSLYSVALLLVLLLVVACATPTKRMQLAAAGAGLQSTVVTTHEFAHLVYRNRADLGGKTDLTLVFIEGDGTPWIDGGRRPSDDPTPHRPLAFDLFLATDHAAWYVTRPCYNRMPAAPTRSCGPFDWTDGRYSSRVVDSLVEALTTLSASFERRRLLLVGYSGGGALAALVAARLDHTIGIITIAANLDTEAWTRYHKYQPLLGSLNPATDEVVLLAPHYALVGLLDTNVPPATLGAFFESHPHSQKIEFNDYDHVCCWARDWPTTLARLIRQFPDQSTADGPK